MVGRDRYRYLVSSRGGRGFQGRRWIPTKRQTILLHTCLSVPGLASEEAGKSSRGSRGCQGRRQLPSNKIDWYWYTVWVARIPSLILPTRMQGRVPRGPGAAKVARGGYYWLATRLMVYDLPGCLWLGLWGGGEELQGQRRMPGQAAIAQ